MNPLTACLLAMCVAAAPRPAPEVRVVLEPGLVKKSTERDALLDEARECIAALRAVLDTPAARAHFQQHYHLQPTRILDREDFAVIVRGFPRHAGPAGVQVGGYVFGESTVDLNVAVLRGALRARDRKVWRRYTAGVLVHELAHLADFLDDGVNNDGGITNAEEGDAAQIAVGCSLRPPGVLPEE